jgi:hypothetical protein
MLGSNPRMLGWNPAIPGTNPECWDRTQDAGIEPRLLGSNRNVNNIEERPPLPTVLGYLFDEVKLRMFTEAYFYQRLRPHYDTSGYSIQGEVTTTESKN